MKRAIYTKEHDEFRAMIRSFITKEVVPHFEQWERDNLADRDLFRKLGELGVMGFGIPEEYGGAGDVGYRYQAVISEECARQAVAFGHYMGAVGIVLPYLLNLANEEQKQRWLPGVAAGDIVLCIAMTEPGTGSDLAGIRTTARLSDDGTHYVLSGQKTFISGARNSELCLVVARTAPEDGKRGHGLSIFAVPTDSPGFEYGRKLDKIGLRCSDTSEIFFSDVKVPVENLLGEQDRAFAYLGQNLVRERLAIGVNTTANAAAAIQFTRAYVQERQVFGTSLSTFQNTKFVLAECATEVAAAQAMVDRAIELEATGELSGADAAKVKLFCTEVAGRVIDKCLQLHGGYGYMLEYPIARLYADTRVSRIYGGTSEVMKTIIAKQLD